MLDSHRNVKTSLESLKRAREVLETPLALRLDVLAGPAQNKSYTTDPGVTQVCPSCQCLHLEALQIQLTVLLEQITLLKRQLDEKDVQLKLFDLHKLFLDTVNHCKFPVFDTAWCHHIPETCTGSPYPAEAYVCQTASAERPPRPVVALTRQIALPMYESTADCFSSRCSCC